MTSLTMDMYPGLSPSRRPGPTKVVSDIYSEPLSDESPIWTVYATAATGADKALVEGWNRGLDTLALFSGLFSAVTSAFIIESYKLMQPDYTELTFRVLSANISGASFAEQDPFAIPPTARAVNALWLTSLAFSLSAALVAVMGKDWIAAYRVPERPNLREWAQLRQFRCNSARRWHMAEVIAFAPLLLHLSLLLFASGLAVFLFPVDTAISSLVIGLSTLAASFYAVIVCSPFLSSSSPFRSPTTSAMRTTTRTCILWLVTACRRLYGLFFWIVCLPRRQIHNIRGRRRANRYAGLLKTPSTSFLKKCGRYSSRLYGSTVTFILHSRTYIAVVPHKIRESFVHSRSDPWNEVLYSPLEFEHTATGVISWLAESSPTPDNFRAVVHALKDAARGPDIAALIGPDVKKWFASGASAFSPLASLTDVSRVIVAANHLTKCEPHLLLDSLLQERIYRIYDHPPSTWNEDLLLAMLYSRTFDAGVCRQLSVHTSTLIRVLDVYDHFKSHFTMNSQLIAKMSRALQLSESECASYTLIKRNNHIRESRYEVHECESTDDSCRLIDLLCFYIQFRSGPILQAALNALIHMCMHHPIQAGHSSIVHLFGRASRTDIVWTMRLWTRSDVGAIMRCIPWSSLHRQEDGDDDAENERALDDNLVRTLAQFLSLDLVQPSITHVAPGSREASSLLSSLIPLTSQSIVVERRVATFLRTVLKDASLNRLCNDGLWAFSELLAHVGNFIARQPDSAAPDVIALFIQLVGLPSKNEQGQWSMAESLPKIIRSSNDDGMQKLLRSLVVLRRLYPNNSCWPAIFKSTQMFIQSGNPRWIPKYTVVFEQFCTDIIGHLEEASSQSTETALISESSP